MLVQNWVWWFHFEQQAAVAAVYNWELYHSSTMPLSWTHGGACNISTRTTEFGSSKSVLDEKPPDIRTTAVALGGVVESMVSWKMLQDLHVHIHIWPLCNAAAALVQACAALGHLRLTAFEWDEAAASFKLARLSLVRKSILYKSSS